MSQYFTYNDLTGRLPMDSIQLDPSCKTCTGAKCYSSFNTISGVSTSKYDSYASIALGENDRLPLPAHMCDVSMLNCHGTPILNPDPYGITVNSPVACPIQPSSYQIELPNIDGPLERSRSESPRILSHRSNHNSSRISSYVQPVPVKLSVSPAKPTVRSTKQVSPAKPTVRLTKQVSPAKLSVSPVKPSVPVVKPVPVKLSVSPARPVSTQTKLTTQVQPKNKSSVGSLIKRLD